MVPKYSHVDPVGIVLEGGIKFVIDGEKQTYTKGDRYYIPEGVKHSGVIYGGYADIAFLMSHLVIIRKSKEKKR